MSRYKEELNLAADLIKNASKITEWFRKEGFQSFQKQDESPVTLADYASQIFIISKLKEYFPEDQIIAEEEDSVFVDKKYMTEQYSDDFWNWPLVNRVLSKFFKHISQKILKLKKAQENKENLEEIIRNWIEQASEGEISPELKVKLKEIVENKENLEVLKLELDTIEIESKDKKDFLEEITKGLFENNFPIIFSCL